MKLRLVKQGNFLGTKCDFYLDEEKNIYMSRTQIGYALRYSQPQHAILSLHQRHKERFDKFSVEVKGSQFETPYFNKDKKASVFMYLERGIYEVCRRSNQPLADDFNDWVYDVISGIAKNGYYIAAGKDDKWLGIRREAKEVRKNETATINKFVDYAESQGSQNARRYYINFTNLVNRKCGVNTGERDKADQKTLLRIKSLETLVDMRIESLMKQNLPYKEVYENVKELFEMI